MAQAQSMPDPEQLRQAIQAVEVVHFPVVQPTTEIAFLLKGLPAEFLIDIPPEYNRAMIAYLNWKRDNLVLYISQIARSTSPYLDVKDVSYREGSLIITVVWGVDAWIRSNIGANYDSLASISAYASLTSALNQLNDDLMKATIAVADSFKDFFQSSENP